jgi:hypothetical protein
MLLALAASLRGKLAVGAVGLLGVAAFVVTLAIMAT